MEGCLREQGSRPRDRWHGFCTLVMVSLQRGPRGTSDVNEFPGDLRFPICVLLTLRRVRSLCDDSASAHPSDAIRSLSRSLGIVR